MQNSSFGKMNILQELPLANLEYGEGIAQVFDEMVTQSGITNPNAEPYQIVNNSWKKLTAKDNKTPEDYAQIDKLYKDEIRAMAESFLLYICREVGNTSGKLTIQDYAKYMLKHRFGRCRSANNPEHVAKVKQQIKNAFKKLSTQGGSIADNMIDKQDMYIYLYALTTKVQKDETGSIVGFSINGVIEPEAYATNEAMLFAEEDNLSALKLRFVHRLHKQQK